ncbi:hypothetical protein FJT64_017878 [Amphibalanus amphitrite]|uniref:Uncharacterized protein n=1 Tax=Amphibalanus amphitrite TaxID=1232801 RepID=A0A6A4WWK9_AMPAM|nr:hypothetical protein FJT64_017878 [Amphibalanus amphitrite]
MPAAKRPLASPAEPTEQLSGEAAPAGVELSAGALAAIQRLVNAGIASVIGVFETKFDKMSKRIELLESEAMDREVEMQHTREKLAQQIQVNSELQAQVESIDLNRRLASLIFTCEGFGRRSADEDAEQMIVSLLNERIPALKLTKADIHAAHRLQRDDKIIAKFVKRSVRDYIYDARFHLSPTGDFQGRRAPLFISESLTTKNQQLYNQLLQVRKSSGGTKVASVFSRRGLVFCRTEKNGPNIRVPDENALRRIIGGANSELPPRGAARAGQVADARLGRGDRRRGAPDQTFGGRHTTRNGAGSDASVAEGRRSGADGARETSAADRGDVESAQRLVEAGAGRSSGATDGRLGRTAAPELPTAAAAGASTVAAAAEPRPGAVAGPPDTAAADVAAVGAPSVVPAVAPPTPGPSDNSV